MVRKLLFVFTGFIILFSCSDNPGDFSFDGDYTSVKETYTDADGIAEWIVYETENNKDITELRSIGTSAAGRDIYAIEISDNPGEAETEPAILINAGIHGNEQISSAVAMQMIDYLITSYRYYTDPDSFEDYEGDLPTEEETLLVANLVENYKLHFIPAVNPDGLDAGSRYNDNYVDINRNFDYTWDESEWNNGDEAFDQSESQALRDDYIKYGYVLSINMHTAASGTYDTESGPGIYGAWDAISSDYAEDDGLDEDSDGDESDYKETYLPNYEIIQELGNGYASEVTESSSYLFEDFGFNIGADWYVMYGSMADWALGERGSVSFTVELLEGQRSTAEDYYLAEEAWKAHKNALLNLVKAGSRSIKGRILDDSTDFVIENARVSLEYTGSASRAMTFTPVPYRNLAGYTVEEGTFGLLTPAGVYNLTVTADGFEDAEFTVSLTPDGSTLFISESGGRFSSLYDIPSYYLTPSDRTPELEEAEIISENTELIIPEEYSGNPENEGLIIPEYYNGITAAGILPETEQTVE